MLLFESDNEYRKICLWKDEIPFDYEGYNFLRLCVEYGDVNWHIGTICIEAKLHPRHVSNYAMICMRYRNNQRNKTDIIINYGCEDDFFISQVLLLSKTVRIGLNREYLNAIDEFFKEYPLGMLSSGTIEIISGGYDEVGSSNMAFKKVMEILVFVFCHIDELSDNELQKELLKLI